MKNLITLLVLFTSLISFGQTTTEKKKDFKLTGITYTMDNVEELKSIDWDILKEAFKNNDEEERISIEIAYNNPDLKIVLLKI